MRQLQLDDPRWLAFLEAQPSAGPFHHPAWAHLVASTYGFRSFAHVLEEDGRIVAGLPTAELRGLGGGRRWVSLPFTDELTPLVAPGFDPARLTAALDDARRRAGVDSVEVRSPLPGAAVGDEAVIHKLRLDPDPQKLFKTFHRSQVQRNVDRARREGVTVRHAASVRDLDTVYYGLHLRTRHRQGVPIQPRRYFRALWKHLLDRGLGFCLIAEHGGAPIGGAVFLTWKRTVIYKYGASNDSHWRLRPNHALHWTAIEWACRNGYELYDFGRTDPENQGLRDFKGSWAAVEEPLLTSCVGDAQARVGSGRAIDVLERTIKRSPPWVCRALGELLYRYAA